MASTIYQFLQRRPCGRGWAGRSLAHWCSRSRAATTAATPGRRIIENKYSNRDGSMTYLQGYAHTDVRRMRNRFDMFNVDRVLDLNEPPAKGDGARGEKCADCS